MGLLVASRPPRLWLALTRFLPHAVLAASATRGPWSLDGAQKAATLSDWSEGLKMARGRKGAI
jgi:hypothetical protein